MGSVPRAEDMDKELRARIRAWLRHYRQTRYATNELLADALGLAEPTITNVLNGRRSAGLDLVYAMHKRLGRSLDQLMDDPAPEEKEQAPPQSQAPSSMARPRGHNRSWVGP
jgi:transcriptional regulator with XRE-family HTH domain